jgi:carbon starvation protein
VASVTPVWILLQPRDYLSSFLLYACIAGATVGALFGAGQIELSYPAFLGFHSDKLGYLFPALFITVACGACSGFHSLVASGTTAKQLDKEPDARLIGYGGMLIEGVLAVIALFCVATLVKGDPTTGMTPPRIFSIGMGKFLGFLGLPVAFGQAFGLLAISTFLLTTLDTGTRLGRYIFEEFFSLKGKWTRPVSTGITLLFPSIFLTMTFHDAAGNVVPAWRIIWPIFGATNQLLAGLALLIVSTWLKSRGKNYFVTMIPMAFMIVMTMTALVILAHSYGLANPVGIAAIILLLLALLLLVEAFRSFLAGTQTPEGKEV